MPSFEILLLLIFTIIILSLILISIKIKNKVYKEVNAATDKVIAEALEAITFASAPVSTTVTEEAPCASPLSKPHYRLVTFEDKLLLTTVYRSAMNSGPGVEPSYPLAAWTFYGANAIIHQAQDLMGWNIVFFRDKFYHKE